MKAMPRKSDTLIQADVQNELRWDTRVNVTDVGVSVQSGVVTLSGTVSSSRELPVVLDFFHANGEGAGGRSYLGKRIVPLGAWTQDFPVDYGAVEVEAYQDLTGDSRTGDDPAARTEKPVTIAGEDVTGISLTIP